MVGCRRWTERGGGGGRWTPVDTGTGTLGDGAAECSGEAFVLGIGDGTMGAFVVWGC